MGDGGKLWMGDILGFLNLKSVEGCGASPSRRARLFGAFGVALRLASVESGKCLS